MSAIFGHWKISQAITGLWLNNRVTALLTWYNSIGKIAVLFNRVLTYCHNLGNWQWLFAYVKLEHTNNQVYAVCCNITVQSTGPQWITNYLVDKLCPLLLFWQRIQIWGWLYEARPDSAIHWIAIFSTFVKYLDRYNLRLRFGIYKLKFLRSIVWSRSIVSQLFAVSLTKVRCIIRYPVDSLSKYDQISKYGQISQCRAWGP